MRVSDKRPIAVFMMALMFLAWSAPCVAAGISLPPKATPAPTMGSSAQCDAVYDRLNFNWAMFQRILAKPTAAGYRFVESLLWRVTPLLNSSLCSTADKTHDRANLDAKRFQIGLLYTIIGAFTEANLEKYQNARAFTNMFHAGVNATINNTKESRAALAVVRKQRPDFDQFLANWTKQIQKLEGILDMLKIPKQTQLNIAEKPGS
jgi:hypothetical protein